MRVNTHILLWVVHKLLLLVTKEFRLFQALAHHFSFHQSSDLLKWLSFLEKGELKLSNFLTSHSQKRNSNPSLVHYELKKKKLFGTEKLNKFV